MSTAVTITVGTITGLIILILIEKWRRAKVNP